MSYVEQRGESLREALLRLVVEQGELADVVEAPRLLATRGHPGTSVHEIVHLLFSLARGGLVTFQTGRDGDAATYRRIRPTRRAASPARRPVTTHAKGGDTGLREPERRATVEWCETRGWVSDPRGSRRGRHTRRVETSWD